MVTVPGTMTDANACQSRVSIADIATSLESPPDYNRTFKAIEPQKVTCDNTFTEFR